MSGVAILQVYDADASGCLGLVNEDFGTKASLLKILQLAYCRSVLSSKERVVSIIGTSQQLLESRG